MKSSIRSSYNVLISSAKSINGSITRLAIMNTMLRLVPDRND